MVRRDRLARARGRRRGGDQRGEGQRDQHARVVRAATGHHLPRPVGARGTGVVHSVVVTPSVPPLRIGPLEVWPPIVLAPMSGVTNRTLRALYKPFGFGLTVTEFVSSNALQHGNARTMEMIDQHGVEQPVSTQLWGNDPAIMALAAKVVRECGADIVDINFGCPAPKVTKTEGGSACLRDVDRCEAIMKAVVDGRRLPGDDEDAARVERERARVRRGRQARAGGRRASDHAARPHGETVLQGHADWSKIAELKRAVDIPVIGNGDLAIPTTRCSGCARAASMR